MEPEQAISTVVTVASAVKEIKGIIDTVPSTNFFLFPNKNKVRLQEKIDSLEKKVNTEFPRLAQLVRSYSSIISEVRAAWAVSDKMSEILGYFKDEKDYIKLLVGQVEGSHGRILQDIGRLPGVNNVYKGQLDQKLTSIRDRIRDLRRESRESSDSQTIQRLVDEICSDYSDMQGILSELLGTITDSLDVSRQ